MRRSRIAFSCFATITLAGLWAWEAAAAETCQDVLKGRSTPITYKALYNIVAGRNLSKDEFESTIAYEKRIKDAIASVNSDIMRVTRHNFVVVSHPIYGFMVKYDADARQMGIESATGLILLRSDAYKDNPLMWVDYAATDDQTFVNETGSYLGSNAFGVTKLISKRDVNSYVIGLYTGNRTHLEWPQGDILKPAKYSVSMPPDVAREAKDRLEVRLVGKLTYPYVFKITKHSSPTISNPFETTENIHGTTIDVHCAALINGADDGIIQYISPDGAAVPPTAQPAQPAQPSAPALSSVPAPSPMFQSGLAFQRGLADRRAWEEWISSLSGDYRMGAEYWAGQRSLPHPGSCQGSPQFLAGCAAARARLMPTDVLRKSEPDYKIGWNAYEY